MSEMSAEAPAAPADAGGFDAGNPPAAHAMVDTVESAQAAAAGEQAGLDDTMIVTKEEDLSAVPLALPSDWSASASAAAGAGPPSPNTAFEIYMSVKKPSTPYILFSKYNQEFVKQEIAAGNLPSAQAAYVLGELWHRLEPEQKQPYIDACARQTEEYHKLLADRGLQPHYRPPAALKPKQQRRRGQATVLLTEPANLSSTDAIRAQIEKGFALPSVSSLEEKGAAGDDGAAGADGGSAGGAGGKGGKGRGAGAGSGAGGASSGGAGGASGSSGMTDEAAQAQLTLPVPRVRQMMSAVARAVHPAQFTFKTEAVSMVTKCAELYAAWLAKRVGVITDNRNHFNGLVEDCQQVALSEQRAQYARLTIDALPGVNIEPSEGAAHTEEVFKRLEPRRPPTIVAAAPAAKPKAAKKVPSAAAAAAVSAAAGGGSMLVPQRLVLSTSGGLGVGVGGGAGVGVGVGADAYDPAAAAAAAAFGGYGGDVDASWAGAGPGGKAGKPQPDRTPEQEVAEKEKRLARNALARERRKLAKEHAVVAQAQARHMEQLERVRQEQISLSIVAAQEQMLSGALSTEQGQPASVDPGVLAAHILQMFGNEQGAALLAAAANAASSNASRQTHSWQ